MRALLGWLNIEASGIGEKWYLIKILLSIKIVYCITAVIVIGVIGIDFPPDSGADFGDMPFYCLLPLLALSALTEEILFRFLPLLITYVLVKQTDHSVLFVVTAVISSIIFGWLHGGPIFIAIQGVVGFLYCMLFLKCGGYHGKWIPAILTCAIAHWIFNSLLVTIELALGA